MLESWSATPTNDRVREHALLCIAGRAFTQKRSYRGARQVCSRTCESQGFARERLDSLFYTPAYTLTIFSLKSTDVNTSTSDIFSDPGVWAANLFGRALVAVKAFLPDLVAGLVLLLVGWLAAWLLRGAILRFGRGLDALLSALQRRAGVSVARPRWSVAAVVASLAFWIVLAFTVIGTSEIFGLDDLAGWLRGLLGYLPTLLIGAAILFIGYLISSGLRDLIGGISVARGTRHGDILGQLVFGSVLVFALLLALGHLGLNVGLLENIIILAAAGLFGGTALAFGIGAADSVRNVMASHYLRRLYQPGQHVRFHDVDGQILELTPVGVLLETDSGQAFIQARSFLEAGAITVVPEEGDGD